MRVAHIIKVTRISGAEGHLLHLLPALRERGVDARLIILVERDKPMDEMATACAERGIPLERLPIGRDLDPGLVWRLRGLLRRIQPEIVHTHLVHADLLGYAAARAAGKARVISSRHNDDSFRRGSGWRRLHRWHWRLIDGGIAISCAIKRFAIEIEGAPADKIQVVRYGLPSLWLDDRAVEAARAELRAELELGQDALLLGMACRLVEQKGIPYALEAFRRIRPAFPRARLVIAGDGPLAGELRRLARMLGIADAVHWLGWRPDAADLMAAFDVFLMPSAHEGFGLALLEAMSRRLPIIASRVSAIPEVVADEENGILVPARDAESLARAMRRLLGDRALRKHMGLLGASRLEERFSVESMAAGALEAYERFGR